MSCPAILGCVSEGDSLADALANVHEAIGLCLAVLIEDGKAPPRETTDAVAQAVRQVLNDRADDGLPLTVETREVEVDVEAAA